MLDGVGYLRLSVADGWVLKMDGEGINFHGTAGWFGLEGTLEVMSFQRHATGP